MKEPNCCYFNYDLPNDVDYKKCRLTHEECKLRPTNPEECMFYRIYEEGLRQGYSEGKKGEDF